MHLPDMILYSLGAAVVAGVSGFVDFGGLLSGLVKGGEDEDGTGESALAQRGGTAGDYQSTLAYFLEEEPESLIALRAAETAQEEAPRDEAGAPPVEDAAEDAPLAVYELPDPEAAPARIEDFVPGTEAIRLEYTPEIDPASGATVVPDVTVDYDGAADLTTIRLAGFPVAELSGAAAIEPADIELVAIA